MNDQNKIVVPESEYWRVIHDHIRFGLMYIRNSNDIILENKILQLPKDVIEGKCKKICSDEDQRGWLLTGGVGSGKTTLMCYMAYLMLKHSELEVAPNDSEKPEVYPFSTDVDEWYIRSYPSYYYIRTGELFNLFFEKKLDRIDELRSCSILFLDDLGVEYSTEYPLSKFEDFIEYRYSELLTTFITTNLTPERLKEDLDWARIVDRLLDKKWMQLVTIAGGSLRGKE